MKPETFSIKKISGKYFKSLAFLLMLSCCIFSAFVHAQTKTENLKELDYCSLFADELKDYESETVNIRALLTYSTVSSVDGGDSFFYLPKCSGADKFAVADFSELIKMSEKWQQFFGDLPKEKNYIFEVVFTGKLAVSIIPTFGHLSWSRAEMKIFEISAIKDVSKSAKKPNFKFKNDLLEKGKSLQTINSEIIFFLFGKQNSFDFGEITANEFVLIDLKSNRYDRENFNEFSKSDFFKEIENYSSRSVTIGNAKRVGEKIKVEGLIQVSNSQRVEKRFNYENTFVLKNAVWILTESKFTML